MSYTEFEYIEICKSQLEQKFSFGNGHRYTQKDLELLSLYIEKEVGVSISLSTLKRVWKNDFKQGPQLATLNALAQTLDYDSWQHFKLKNKTQTLKPEIEKNKTPTNIKNFFFTKKIALLSFFTITVLCFLWSLRLQNEKEHVINHNSIIFRSNKTLTKGTPNTVIFNYDISKVKADSFFIQQSWNRWRKEKINPNDKVFSSTYYESGYHRAKLIANDQIISELPIHILSNGWEAHSYYKPSDEPFINFKDINFINEGKLHLTEAMLQEKNMNTRKSFVTRISHSMVYNVSSSNFNFIAKTKLDQNPFNTNCPWYNVLVITEKHIFSVGLRNKGCETFTHYKLGEISRSGKNTDLSLLGVDVFDWNFVGFKVEKKKATILINGAPTYTEEFKEDFGKIVGLVFIYEGTGSIDYVKLSDEKENIVFEDDFNDSDS